MLAARPAPSFFNGRPTSRRGAYVCTVFSMHDHGKLLQGNVQVAAEALRCAYGEGSIVVVACVSRGAGCVGGASTHYAGADGTERDIAIALGNAINTLDDCIASTAAGLGADAESFRAVVEDAARRIRAAGRDLDESRIVFRELPGGSAP